MPARAVHQRAGSASPHGMRTACVRPVLRGGPCGMRAACMRHARARHQRTGSGHICRPVCNRMRSCELHEHAACLPNMGGGRSWLLLQLSVCTSHDDGPFYTIPPPLHTRPFHDVLSSSWQHGAQPVQSAEDPCPLAQGLLAQRKNKVTSRGLDAGPAPRAPTYQVDYIRSTTYGIIATAHLVSS